MKKIVSIGGRVKKIEQKMLNAIKENRCWKQGNTQVRCIGCIKSYDMIFIEIELYGSLIAVGKKNPATGETRVAVVPQALHARRYRTATTASRLRALGFAVIRSKDGSMLVNGQNMCFAKDLDISKYWG